MSLPDPTENAATGPAAQTEAAASGAKRQFAGDVVARLRRAGYEAYWAGGCVRDWLLGRPPKDFDVATSARPEEVRAVFGARRTLALGAAFGVITVLGPRAAGMVEVATFREDLGYSDGRHPDAVRYSSAEADAQRRDFTINGLFLDPADERVLDFVGGQADLAAGVVRAIGNAETRFEEDKLRMLRAVRFAAGYGFRLDAATATAMRAMAPQIASVSAERVAEEMRRMFVGPGRVRAVELLIATELAGAVLPEIMPPAVTRTEQGAPEAPQRAIHPLNGLRDALAALERLAEPSFPLALATLLAGSADADAVPRLARRWRLSTKERERTAWLVAHADSLRGAANARWSLLQPLLVHEGRDELLALSAARGALNEVDQAFCLARLAWPPAELDPPPLLTGDDLKAGGLKPGPAFAQWLARLRAAQLDGEARTPADAWALVRRWVAC